MHYAKLIILLLLLSGCSTLNNSQELSLPSHTTVALMPLVNHSQTPLAGERAEDILSSLLHQQGINLVRYPRQADNADILSLDDQSRFLAAESWLETSQSDYVLTGSVEEWRYKVGLDSEPAVGVTLAISNRASGKLLWTATGARSGWGRDSLAGVAQTLLSQLSDSLLTN